jgi:hypothetical protein
VTDAAPLFVAVRVSVLLVLAVTVPKLRVVLLSTSEPDAAGG